MKKQVISIFIAVLMLFAALVATGCKPSDSDEEKIDETRTQIYVNNFGGGYGDQWLKNAKYGFEEKYKDVVLEKGKQGVQIMITSAKSDIATEAATGKYDVFFAENAYYYELLAENLMLDITAAVTENLQEEFGENGTIAGKLNSAQENYLNADGKYYAVPHYAGYQGFSYDRDLFEKENFFFADDPAKSDNGFIVRTTDKKSAGRDGEYGTFDDGLPVTYAEFYKLLDRIESRGYTPLIWNGKYNVEYLSQLIFALYADFEGYEQMMLNYNFGEGVSVQAENVVQSISGTGFSASVVHEQPFTVTAEEGYRVLAQEGRLRALQFLEKLIKTPKYYDSLSFNYSQTHIEAQDNFLVSAYAKAEGKKQIAMIQEGTWWENEAEESMAELADTYGPDAARGARRFGFMPLPVFDETSRKDYTLYDALYSLSFVYAGVPDFKKDMAVKFLQYVNTDEMLVDFTKTTGVPKAMKYEIPKETLQEMTYFGQSLCNMFSVADIVYPFSSSEIYIDNQADFAAQKMLDSVINNQTFNSVNGIRVDGKTAEELFLGTVPCYSKKWNSYLGK